MPGHSGRSGKSASFRASRPAPPAIHSSRCARSRQRRRPIFPAEGFCKALIHHAQGRPAFAELFAHFFYEGRRVLLVRKAPVPPRCRGFASRVPVDPLRPAWRWTVRPEGDTDRANSHKGTPHARQQAAKPTCPPQPPAPRPLDADRHARLFANGTHAGHHFRQGSSTSAGSGSNSGGGCQRYFTSYKWIATPTPGGEGSAGS